MKKRLRMKRVKKAKERKKLLLEKKE